MANWASRAAFGVALCALAPVSARLAVSGRADPPGAAAADRPTDVSTSITSRGEVTSKSTVKGDANRMDSLDPAQAKRLSITETQTEFRRTLCGFLMSYAKNQASRSPTEDPTREAMNTPGSPKPARRPKPAQVSNRAGASIDVCANPADGEVEAMIAVLPDPVRTHLSLRFDRAVDDIENAAQRLGWVFDKAWLPWRNEPRSVPIRLQERYIDEQMQRSREDQPGLLLFRQTAGMKPLVILVVGDTPTDGVNGEQFRNALQIWNEVHTRSFALANCPGPASTDEAQGACLPRRRLMILGPSFSGSAPSLKNLLMEKGAVEGVDVVAASGTMTSSDLLQSLNSDGKNSSVTAKSFAADLSYMRAHLLAFLDDHLPRRDSGIAELTEEESQFGAQTPGNLDGLVKELKNLKLKLAAVQKKITLVSGSIAASEDKAQTEESHRSLLALLAKQRDWKNELRRTQNFLYFLDGLLNGNREATWRQVRENNKPLVPSWGAPIQWLKGRAKQAQKYQGCVSEEYAPLLDDRPEFIDCSAKRPQGRPYLQLSFPREISVLRQAYEQNGIMGFGAAADSNVPRTQLRLNFSETTSNGDAAPAFGGAQSASSMESRMAQIAATLEKEKIAVAVLSATDVIDDIFVARFLHEHAPSVTVVIQDADLLFLRGGSDASLDGAYVVSPYPLIPENGQWSADLDSPLQPSPVLAQSQGDEGLVNAATYLLCGRNRDESTPHAGQGCGWKTRDGIKSNYLWMNEYEPPMPVDQETDNDYKLQPPLWLSVIAHGSFQPVSLIDFDQRAKFFPESSVLSLPRLGEVREEPPHVEIPVWDTHPAGIQDEPLGELYVCLASLLMLLGVHAWACLNCRLDRTFAWSYAAADEKPWLTRLTVQIGLNLLGIYALSLLLLHDFPGFHMEPLWLKIVIVSTQVLLVLLSAAVSLRSAVRRDKEVVPTRIAAAGPDDEIPSKSVREQNWEEEVHWAITWVALVGSALFMVLVDCVWWRVFGPRGDAPGARTFFWYRSAYLLSGASPTTPLLLLCTGLAVWLRGRLAKLVFYGYRIPKLPSVATEFRCPCDDSVSKLNRLLGSPMWENSRDGKPIWNEQKLKVALTSFALVGGCLLITRQLGPHSLAWSWFDFLVDILALAVAVGTVHNLLVSLLAWRMLQGECLVPLRQSQLRWGFNWIRGFSWKRLWTSPEGFTAEAELEYVMRNVEADGRGQMARSGSSDVRKSFATLLDWYGSHDQTKVVCESGWQLVTSPVRWVRTSARRARRSADWAEKLALRGSNLYSALAEESNARLANLRGHWQSDFGPITGPDTDRGFHNGRKPADLNEPARSTSLQRMADEEFVAMVYLTYIRSVLVQIRNRVATSAMLYILLLWALSSYVWMNRHGILLQMSALLTVLAVVAITIYSQLHRDEILSRTTETTTGKLDAEFFTKVLSVVGIPALTLLATQFPEFSNAIFSWLVPSLSSVR